MIYPNKSPVSSPVFNASLLIGFDQQYEFVNPHINQQGVILVMFNIYLHYLK